MDTRSARQLDLLRKLCVAVVIMFTAVGIAACGTSQHSTDPPLTAPTPADIVAPAPREVAAVVDPSASFSRGYLNQALEMLADGALAVPGQLPKTGAFPGRAGMDFSLRIVSGHSFAPDSVEFTAEIPSVPAINPITADSGGDINTQDALDVAAQRKAAEAAFTNAQSAVSHLVAELKGLHLTVTHCSDIQGDISAAAEAFSHQPGVQHVLIVISDFQQACTPNIAGSLSDVDFLGVIACETADECAANERSFAPRLTRARTHQFIQLDALNAADMVRNYMTGGAP